MPSRFSLHQILAQRHTPPFAEPLPGRVAETVAAETPRERFRANWSLLRRWAYARLALPGKLLRERLPPTPARLLWINVGTEAIGDGLMDLAGRALLDGYELDLFSSPQAAPLYQTDRFFRRVFTQAAEVDGTRYDFVLLDVAQSRTLKLKRRLCPKAPAAYTRGFFGAGPFNRILFSCYRVHQLMGRPHSPEQLQPFLRSWLFLGEGAPRPPGNAIQFSLSVGGVVGVRTYQRWPEVLGRLLAGWPAAWPEPQFTLVGSANGAVEVGPICQALSGRMVVSHVGTLSLLETARVIAAGDFFLGPDGGLMHCALALGLPGLALFGNIPPAYRLPPQTVMHALCDGHDVNGLPPERVAQAVLSHPRLAELAAGMESRHAT